MSTPQTLDRTLLALADPTRRAILQRLSSGEARVTEVARPFSISLNAVSKHILVLERAKLVKRRRVSLMKMASSFLMACSSAPDQSAALNEDDRDDE